MNNQISNKKCCNTTQCIEAVKMNQTDQRVKVGERKGRKEREEAFVTEI